MSFIQLLMVAHSVTVMLIQMQCVCLFWNIMPLTPPKLTAQRQERITASWQGKLSKNTFTAV